MKKQGRTKYQTSKQFSSDSPDAAVNFLWAFFGENAMSAIHHFARECEAVRPVLKRFEILRSEQPEIAASLRDGVEATVERAGRFLISADVKTLQAYVNARIALEDQGQSPVDRVRVQLIQSHQYLSQTLRRLPTVKELRETAGKVVRGLKVMDESQFRRTIKQLRLDTTRARDLDKLRTIYRKMKDRLGSAPQRSEFFSAANKANSYAKGMSLDDFVEICVRDGMEFSDS